MDLAPLLYAFFIVAVAELGDKTQLATITLSARYRALSVFMGAMLAIALIDGVSILAGIAIGNAIPMNVVGVLGGAIFTGFGIYTLIHVDTGDIKPKRGKFAILTSFSLISVMELGDKTQLVLIAISAKYDSPALIFTGMILAFTLLMGVGVIIGSKLPKIVPMKHLQIFTGALFLLFGALFLLDAAGITLM